MSGTDAGWRDLLDKLRGLSGTADKPLPDHDVKVRITLEEAYHGAEKLIALPAGPRIELRLPRGVRHGAVIKVNPRGKEFRIAVDVEPHAWFQRNGDDLRATVVVDALSALTGKTVLVPTMTGRTRLTIPPLTRDGAEFRLPDAGMPMFGDPSRFGDLLCVVEVKA